MAPGWLQKAHFEAFGLPAATLGPPSLFGLRTDALSMVFVMVRGRALKSEKLRSAAQQTSHPLNKTHVGSPTWRWLGQPFIDKRRGASDRSSKTPAGSLAWRCLGQSLIDEMHYTSDYFSKTHAGSLTRRWPGKPIRGEMLETYEPLNKTHGGSLTFPPFEAVGNHLWRFA